MGLRTKLILPLELDMMAEKPKYLLCPTTKSANFTSETGKGSVFRLP